MKVQIRKHNKDLVRENLCTEKREHNLIPFSLTHSLTHTTSSIQQSSRSLSLSLSLSLGMEIPEKLLKLRYHFVAGLLFCVTLLSLTLVAPRFMTLLAYFWPLFLSTALVLALVFVFAKTSPLPPTDSSLHKTLLDYVTGHPEPPLDTHNKSD